MAFSAKSVAFTCGTPVRVQARVNRAPARVSVRTTAKYGEESRYFDLNDLENTVGSWDMYGQEDEKRYPDIQNEFFERAGSSLSSRGAMLRFIAVGGAAAIMTWGAKGSKDVALPITIGPQTSGENGKGGKTGRL